MNEKNDIHNKLYVMQKNWNLRFHENCTRMQDIIILKYI